MAGLELTIAIDRYDNVLRSRSDELPGIVGFAWPDGEATFVVDPTYQPGGIVGPMVGKIGPAGIEAGQIPVDVDDLIAGAAGAEELAALVEMAAQSLAATIAVYTANRRFDCLRSALDLLERTAEAAEAEAERRNEPAG